MKHLATFLLLFCVTLGLAAQAPAQALAPSAAQMSMPMMSQSDMAAMPDCMASMAKDASHKPCKCGLSGCLAMMASGASFMQADGVVAPAAVLAKDRQGHAARVPTLRGRTTTPEPEPPTLFA